MIYHYSDVDLINPTVEAFDIERIAHALSQQCRYNGHTRQLYSVAEHCVRLSRAIESKGTDAARWALLHDCAEAFIGDVVRPVRALVNGFDEIESRLLSIAAQRFGLTLPVPGVVWRYDDAICHAEARDLFDTKPPWCDLATASMFDTIVPWEAGLARRFFLARYVELDLRVPVDKAMSNAE